MSSSQDLATSYGDGVPSGDASPSASPVEASHFAALARILQAQRDTESTVRALCQLAVEATGADASAVTVVTRRSFRTVGATAELCLDVDRLQYELDEGPCLDALRESERFRSGDLGRDPRWPRFGPRVTDGPGVRSMMSHRLFLQTDTMGALNVYSRRRDAFAPELSRVMDIFVAHAAVAIRAAEDHARMENLQSALESNRRIGTALGILMTTRGLTEPQAFELLRTLSQNTNRKVADLADEVLYTGTLPEGDR